MTAPVTGSGCWPAWTAAVSKRTAAARWRRARFAERSAWASSRPALGQVLDEIDLGDDADDGVALLDHDHLGVVEDVQQLDCVAGVTVA